MATYKVAICLENMLEPFYFSEKFVEAVCAGCIPVYRAHPTVANGVLQGARWIEPGDSATDMKERLAEALAADRGAFQEQNAAWLASGALATSSEAAVLDRLVQILMTE